MAAMTPRALKVSANGLEHNVLEWSSGDHASSVVLLHGYMDAAGTWDLVAPALVRAGMRVLAPDMRGFGDGPRAPRGSYYHFADYVADLLPLVDATVHKNEELFLVGHSMGGTIATLFSGARPDRVARLALLEGVGPPDMPPDMAPIRMRKWLDDLGTLRARANEPGSRERAFATREEALKRLMMSHSNVDRAILETRLDHLVRDAGDGKLAWRFDPLHKTTSPTAFSSAVFSEFAKRVTCPVLFVGGGAMGFHPADEDARLAAFARVTRRDLEDAGHMLHWTKPNELSTILVEFLRGTLD
jgi:pimeloyl-ACP methyl ester carboxylesterase